MSHRAGSGFLLVSACLLGERCRWDGAVLDDARRPGWPEDWERRAICPEAELGLGTPRPPITLAGPSGGTDLVRRSDGVSLGGSMRALCRERVAELLAMGCCGAVLKARSPSCGLGDAERFADAGTRERWGGWPPPTEAPPPGTVFADGWGLLAEALREADPDLPLISDEAFLDAEQRVAFLAMAAARRGGPTDSPTTNLPAR